uniref:Phosphoinositide phospholipase C n=1 Tax=Fundulus heteroclitus TaxID=8078 RepID=A0A3Q2QK22_FUNHE
IFSCLKNIIHSRALPKAWILDNEDIRMMMQGCSMVKVRSLRWQKSRSLRLLDDGLTVWCETTKSSRKGKSQQTFAVTEVDCVREGCQSDALRRLSGTVPDEQCFTVIFKGSRKSLDLMCPSAQEAQRWVRGIRFLKERVGCMTQKEKLDQYPRADENQDGKMTYDEVKRLLQMINIDLNEQHTRCLFKRCDKTCDDRLDHNEIEEFCREIMRRPELDAVFRHYSSNGSVLSTAELRDFLGDQGEDASLKNAQSLIFTYEFNDRGRSLNPAVKGIKGGGGFYICASPYPLILSLENHCSVEQQAVMAKHLRTILGKKLLTEPLSDLPPKELPSPEELRGRILVKGKRHPPHLGQLGKNGSFASFSSSCEDEQASTNKNDPQSCSKMSKELSELVVYCNSVSFRGFESVSKLPPDEMSSFSENEALKLIKDSGKLFVRHNSRQLSRIYPSGQRLQSSNFDPQEMWNGGCHMVALNFQTPGEQMDLNQGRFLPNGRCGYILKPRFMCSPTSDFNPENTGGGPGHTPTQLTIRIISAQQLPKINTEKASSIVDPQVMVEIHGVAIDKARKKTHRIDNNGFNPRWDCTLSFQLQVPELALVRFVVEDHDHAVKNDFVGQFTLPFTSLRTGYRHVHLLKADGSSLSPATLFIHVKVSRGGVPVKSVAERIAMAKGKV